MCVLYDMSWMPTLFCIDNNYKCYFPNTLVQLIINYLCAVSVMRLKVYTWALWDITIDIWFVYVQNAVILNCLRYRFCINCRIIVQILLHLRISVLCNRSHYIQLNILVIFDVIEALCVYVWLVYYMEMWCVCNVMVFVWLYRGVCNFETDLIESLVTDAACMCFWALRIYIKQHNIIQSIMNNGKLYCTVRWFRSVSNFLIAGYLMAFGIRSAQTRSSNWNKILYSFRGVHWNLLDFDDALVIWWSAYTFFFGNWDRIL